jgi:hypothetical protein
MYVCHVVLVTGTVVVYIHENRRWDLSQYKTVVGI